jgi:TolB-like protein
MICSINSSIDVAVAKGLLLLLLLSGCALTSGAAGDPLAFESLTRDDVGTPTAGATTIRWTASATGGTGELRYEFRTRRGSVETIEQVGSSPTWDWRLSQAGVFSVKAAVEDSAGSRVGGDWSPEFAVVPPLGKSALIAVLPVENLSGGIAPLDVIADLVRLELGENGFQLLDDATLADFMRRYRIRNTSGLSASASKAINEETGAAAYLVTSLEQSQDLDDPKLSLIARLVSAGERPEIVWMGGVSLSGDGYPGFLGLDLVDDPNILLDQAVRCLVESLERSLWLGDESIRGSANKHFGCNPRGEVVASSPERKGKRKYRPQSYYRSPTIEAGKRYRVAVLPFVNLTDRKNAGKIVALHFVDQLTRAGNIAIVEPGLVREQLLQYRIIMQSGPSIANAEIISSESSLGADLVFSGTVFDYQDVVGIPKVDFSVKIIHARSKSLIWSSRSYNDGNERVFFYDFGRVYTAHRLVSEMAWGTFQALAHGDVTPVRHRVGADAMESK